MNRFAFYSVVFRGRFRVSLPTHLLLAVLAVACCMPKFASAKPASKISDPPDKTQITALLDELDDIDFARSVSPLKLTPEQVDKLVAVISDAKTQYDKKIDALSAATVGEMADEIHKRHKDSVAGSPSSDVFDKKVQRVLKDFYARRDVVNSDNIVSMTAACGKILTADQKKIATQLEKDTFVRLKKSDPSNTDAQYFNQYVVDIFISYRRIVPLLKEMKDAKPAA